MPLPASLAPFFMLCDDGGLMPLRGPARVLRERFAYHYATINTGVELRATLRAGPYAWPGGYPVALLLSDGGTLCMGCARQELRQVLEAVKTKSRAGWRVTGSFVNWEDNNCHCTHCGGRIPSAYGNDGDEDNTGE